MRECDPATAGYPWLGGGVIDADFGYTATACAGAALTAAAIGTTAVSLRLHRRTRASRLVAGTNDSTARPGTVNPVRTDV